MLIFFFFVTGYLLVRSVITGLRILRILQRNKDFILLPFDDGIITPYGFTAGGKPHLGGNSTDATGIHNVSPPVTGHQAPISFTRHWELTGKYTRCQTLGTGQPGTSHRLVNTRHQAQGTSHRAPGTSH